MYMQAAKRKGLSMEVLSHNMDKIEQLVPGLVNLHKAKASDWVSYCLTHNTLQPSLALHGTAHWLPKASYLVPCSVLGVAYTILSSSTLSVARCGLHHVLCRLLIAAR